MILLIESACVPSGMSRILSVLDLSSSMNEYIAWENVVIMQDKQEKRPIFVLSFISGTDTTNSSVKKKIAQLEMSAYNLMNY